MHYGRRRRRWPGLDSERNRGGGCGWRKGHVVLPDNLLEHADLAELVVARRASVMQLEAKLQARRAVG